MLPQGEAAGTPAGDDTSDQALAQRASRGDTEAFGSLVQRYQSAVYNVCYRLMGERGAAEDLAQEAFVRAYQRLDRYDPARPFGPWVRRVAANLCLNALEMRRPPFVSLDDERDAPMAAPAEHDPATAHEQAEEAAAVRAALLGLPPHYRAVIELRHFQELSYAEIAAALRLPVSDVKSHLFRARQLLARRLNPPD
jgi:RNA polymerase sigma-70 factor (ECF subfamily)